ncbi:MAG: sigma 54-interacting transcriptional regulator [Deltaproteobacteria bacterium]
MKVREKVRGQRPAEIKALRKELDEAKKRETQLVEAMQNLEAAFENQGRDLGERIKELECLFNISKLAQRFDMSLEQVLQDAVDQIPPAWQHPEKTMARLILENQEVTSEDFRESAWNQVVDIEVRGKRIGRLEVHYLEEGYKVHSSPFLAEERDLLTAVAEIISVIVDRRRSEVSTRESDERFRAIFEDARDSIYIKDLDQRYVKINPAMEELLGIPASKVIGHMEGEVFGEETGRQSRSFDRRVLAGEFVEFIQTRPVKGIPLTFHDKRVPLRDNSGRVSGIFGIARNITELTKGPSQPSVKLSPDRYRSKAMRECLKQARIGAATNSIILLLGETGSGKDYLARWIHDQSKRAAGPYFALNCAALPHELAESELFGHEPGAFTGARAGKKGLLELAEGGTLLLNEIGELPLSIQSKLLSFLDTRSFLRVGGDKGIKVDARLIAATHRDLAQEIAEGSFLEPLFYRLNVFPIQVPPLRDRLEDIPVLIREILAKLATEMQIDVVPEFNSEQISALSRYDWPGNVRELRNVLERALMVAGKESLRFVLPGSAETDDEWKFTSLFPSGRSLRDAREDLMRALCHEAIRRCKGNRTAAAKLLGMSRNALYRHLSGGARKNHHDPE